MVGDNRGVRNAIPVNHLKVPGPIFFQRKKKMTEKNKIEGPWYHRGDGPYDVDTPGCYFFRLPRVSRKKLN